MWDHDGGLEGPRGDDFMDKFSTAHNLPAAPTPSEATWKKFKVYGKRKHDPSM